MRRLASLAIAGTMLLLAGTSTGAAEKTRRLAVVLFGSAEAMQPSLRAFREGLRSLGYVEGRDISIEYRFAEGREDRLPTIAAEAVSMQPDVIMVAGSRVVQAVKQATSTIPIVVAVMGDPIAPGFVASYARPGGNITGLSFQDSELVTKRAELLKEIVPGLSRVALLYDPGAPAGAPNTVLDAAMRAVRAFGLEPQPFEIRTAADLAPAMAAARAQGSQAAIQLASTFFNAHRKVLVDEAAHARLPLICEQASFVALGCLISYGPDFLDMYGRTAVYVDRVLKGSDPGELPVQQPDKFELVVNLKTARALGLEMPPPLLARADQVIE